MDRRRFLQRTTVFTGLGLMAPITGFATSRPLPRTPKAGHFAPSQKYFDTPLKFVEYLSIEKRFRRLHQPWDVSSEIGGDYSPQIGDTLIYSAKHRGCTLHVLLRPSRRLPREEVDTTVSPPRAILISPPEDRTGLVDMAIYVTFDKRRPGLHITLQEKVSS